MQNSDRINKAIDNLLIDSRGEIKSRIEELSFNVKLDETNTIIHSYCLKADGNGNLRLADLIDYLDEKIVDYAIPKKEIDEAKRYQDETGSSQKWMKLRKKANGLFTDLEKTGEGGEILLYILIEEFLKIPQLISKMSLKTSGALHYQGADGIHVKYDANVDTLNLYWGEAKMYSDMKAGIRECFKSLKSFLLDPISSKSVQERDLQLITANISNNVNDEELENAIVRYFDKDDDLSNKLVYKGICFIGFDTDKYPKEEPSCTTELIKNALTSEIESWHSEIGKKLIANSGLNLKEIHVFLMPFPSVEKFREFYINGIQ